MDHGLRRLTEALVREDGSLRPATWDEAYERAAAGFARVRARGPNAFGVFSCSKTTNEMNFMAQKFTRAVVGSKQRRQLQPDLTRYGRPAARSSVRSHGWLRMDIEIAIGALLPSGQTSGG
jgi:formate dehydrogenase (hydrogenase)